MANRYWVGGTGLWHSTAHWSTTSGGPGGASIPTGGDVVYFNQPGTYTVYVQSVQIGTYTSPLNAIYASNGTITFDGMYAVFVDNVSFAGAAVTLYSFYTYFYMGHTGNNCSIYAPGNDLTNLNITVNYNSVGSPTFTMSDLKCRYIDIYPGTDVYCLSNTTVYNYFSCGGVLRLQSYTFTTYGFFAANAIVKGTSTVVYSPINVSGITNSFGVYNQSLNNVVLNCVAGPNYNFPIAMSGTGATFANLTVGVSGTGVAEVYIGNTLTVTGSLNAVALNQSSRLFLHSLTYGTSKTLSIGSLTGDYMDFRDIAVTGAASPINVPYSGNCGNNTGITFSSGVNKYLKAAAATDVNFSSNVWALSSGGAVSTNNFPLAQDTIVIDSNSVATSLIYNQGYALGTINNSKSGFYININNQATNMYGIPNDSVEFRSTSIVGAILNLLRNDGTTQPISDTIIRPYYTINVYNPSGAYLLTDINLQTNLTYNWSRDKNFNFYNTVFNFGSYNYYALNGFVNFYINNSTININGKTIECARIEISGNGTVNFGSNATITSNYISAGLNQAGFGIGAGITVTGSGQFNIAGVATQANNYYVFSLYGYTDYSNFTLNNNLTAPAAIAFLGGGTFGTIKNTPGSGGFQLSSGYTLNVGEFNVRGNSTNKTIVYASDTYTDFAYINKTTPGPMNCDYLDLYGTYVTGTAPVIGLFAGANSIDNNDTSGGNDYNYNYGWTFTNLPSMLMVF